ncbi:MAG TPA: hypothetical protein VEA63_10705, partial [Opitutus sp.]|nr:hypothetical protein [Opitutus sp.]
MSPSLHRSSRLRSGFHAASLASVALLFAACGKQQNAAPATPSAMEVGVLVVQPETVALSREVPGRLSPYRIAEVRARINGIVQ